MLFCGIFDFVMHATNSKGSTELGLAENLKPGSKDNRSAHWWIMLQALRHWLDGLLGIPVHAGWEHRILT